MENLGGELEEYNKNMGILLVKQKLAIEKYFTSIDDGLGKKLQTNMTLIDEIMALVIKAKNKNSLVPISPGVTSDLHEQQVPEDVKVMSRDLCANFAYGTMSADCSPAQLVTFLETVSKTPGASTIFTRVQDHPELRLPVSALFTPFLRKEEGDAIHPFLSHGEMEDSVEKRNRLFQRRITNLFRLMEESFNQLKKDLHAGVEEQRNRNKSVMEANISSVEEKLQKIALSGSHLGVGDSTSTPVQASSHDIPTLTVEEVEATAREVDKLTPYFSLADGSALSSNLLFLVGYLEGCQNHIESIIMFARVQRTPDLQVAPFLIRNWLCKENGVVPDEELVVALRGLELCYFLHPESRELALESKILHILVTMLRERSVEVKISSLKTLIAVLTSSTGNIMDFIAIKGLEKITEILRNKSENGHLRSECGKFVIQLIQAVNGPMERVPMLSAKNIYRVVEEPIILSWIKSGDAVHPYLAHEL